jgi:hypothetical protein
MQIISADERLREGRGANSSGERCGALGQVEEPDLGKLLTKLTASKET